MFLGAGRVARGLSRMGHAGFLRCRSTRSAPLRSATHALASRPWHWHHLTPAKDHDFRSQWPFHPFCGHHHGAERLTKTNDFGNAVEEMGVDYQMSYQGGNGQMRLNGFDLPHNTIDVLSSSPWVGCTSPAACRRPCAAGQLVGRDLLVDRWVHVAIVGNPAKGETTMYGEGATVLRNSADASGIASPRPGPPCSGGWCGLVELAARRWLLRPDRRDSPGGGAAALCAVAHGARGVTGWRRLPATPSA